MLTAILMFVITAVATDTRAVGAAAAIAIGGTVALDALFAEASTGASMNPARSFGPALVANQWTDFWVYLLAPITGAIAGAVLYQVDPRRHTDHNSRPTTRGKEERCTSYPCCDDDCCGDDCC